MANDELKRSTEKVVDIELLDTQLRILLENYRQALRSIELLPRWGRVSTDEYKPAVGRLLKNKKSLFGKRTTLKIEGNKPTGDLVNNRFSCQFVVKTLLRSHIRSKLKKIIELLEIEQLSTNTAYSGSKERIEELLDSLKKYREQFGSNYQWLSKIGSGIWGIFILLIPVLVSQLLLPDIDFNASSFITYLTIWLLFIGFFLGLPLYGIIGLGGWRWKRLILTGEVNDVLLDHSIIMRWNQSPTENTYHLENNVFAALEISKPKEFPWDMLLSPDKLLLGILAISFVLISFAIAVAMKEVDWPFFVVLALVFIAMGLLSIPINSIKRTIKFRSQHNLS